MTQAEAHNLAAVPEVVAHDSEIFYGPALDSRVSEQVGRGSDDDWCSTPGAEGQHAYSTYLRGGSLVTVDRCFSCGHINFGDLNNQIKALIPKVEGCVPEYEYDQVCRLAWELYCAATGRDPAVVSGTVADNALAEVKERMAAFQKLYDAAGAYYRQNGSVDEHNELMDVMREHIHDMEA